MTALATDPLRWWARNAAGLPAITFDGADTVTFAEFDAWTDNVAHWLAERRVSPGDRVGIVGNNSLDWCAGAIGALKAGATVAAYNHRFVAAELAHLVADSAPTVVLAGAGHVPIVRDAAEQGSTKLDLLALAEVAALRQAAARPFPRLEIDPDQPAVLIYTSGTTAAPKGVIYTHTTIFAFVLEWSLMEPALHYGTSMEFVLSLGVASGILWAVLLMLILGGHLYLEPGFDAQRTLQRLDEERVEVFLGVPLLIEQIAQLPGFAGADLSALKLATVAGARCQAGPLRAWLEKGVTLRQMYGGTELGGASTANAAHDAIRRPECVGRGGMFTRHRVVRPDGTDCDPGEPGEIVVRGPAVTPGYWRNEEATAAATRDGWFHTGDVGIFDDEGLLRVVDRMKDLIISGAYNIAPAELEEIIDELPQVDEVAVVAVPDERYGETPAAILYPNAPVDTADVLRHCRTRLASFKVPGYVVITDEPLPRMPSGKIAKRELRERYASLPGQPQKVR